MNPQNMEMFIMRLKEKIQEKKQQAKKEEIDAVEIIDPPPIMKKPVEVMVPPSVNRQSILTRSQPEKSESNQKQRKYKKNPTKQAKNQVSSPANPPQKSKSKSDKSKLKPPNDPKPERSLKSSSASFRIEFNQDQVTVQTLQKRSKIRSAQPKENNVVQTSERIPKISQKNAKSIVDKSKQSQSETKKNQIAKSMKSDKKNVKVDKKQTQTIVKKPSEKEVIVISQNIVPPQTKIPKTQTNCLNQHDQSFLNRRIHRKGEKIDLSILSIEELLEQCEIQKVITPQLYFDFLGNYSIEDTKLFLSKMNKQDLKSYDWNRIKFTLADHRRLSLLLVRLSPKLYKIGSPYSLYPAVTTALKHFYSLPQTQYDRLVQNQDKISGLTWWRNIQIKFNLAPKSMKIKYVNQISKAHDLPKSHVNQTKETRALRSISRDEIKMLTHKAAIQNNLRRSQCISPIQIQDNNFSSKLRRQSRSNKEINQCEKIRKKVKLS